MINGLDIYYSKIGRGLKPIINKGSELKPVSTNKKRGNGLKPISNKGRGCKKVKGSGLRILQ